MDDFTVPDNVWDREESRNCTKEGCTQQHPEFSVGRRGGWCIECTREYNRLAYRRRNNVDKSKFRYGDDRERGEYKKRNKKKCSKCCKTKTLRSFSDKPDSRDGKQSWCKSCFANYRNAHKYTNGTPERKKQQVQFTGLMYKIPQRSILMRLRRAKMEDDRGLYPAGLIDPEWVKRLEDDGLVIKTGDCYKLTPLGVDAVTPILLGDDGYLTPKMRRAFLNY